MRGLSIQQQPLDEEVGKTVSLIDIIPKEHKLYHPIKFISNNYGDNPENIIKAITAITDFHKGLKFLNNGKKFSLKSAFDLLRYTLPASLYGIEMAFKIKKYLNKVNKKELSEYEKREKRLMEFLGVEKSTISYRESQYLNEEIIFWLLKSPKTNGYEIKGYYNSSFKVLDKVTFEAEFNQILILVEYNEKKILLELNVTKLLNSYFCELQYASSNSNSLDEITQELEALIIKDFILTFNTQENILEYMDGLVTRKRLKVEEKINQFDIEPLRREIKKVLEHGRKRGYDIIGLQGTGKTMIIKKLEEILTDVIIIKLGARELSSSYRIKKCFQFIKIIQPALVVIEDLDALGFKEKNERVGTFINEIDDSNNDLNIVLMVTINDTELVHKTIIDRPGRFDETIEIKPPQSEREVYEVMVSKFSKLKQYYTEFKGITFPPQHDIEHLLKRCLKNKFTQAEITCGIVEKIFLNIEIERGYTFITEMERAITLFEQSKKSLREYSFNEKNPVEEEKEMEEDCTMTEKVSPIPPENRLYVKGM